MFRVRSKKRTSISTRESAGFSRVSSMWHFHHSLSSFEVSHLGIESEKEWNNQPLPNPTSKGNPEIQVGRNLGDLEVL